MGDNRGKNALYAGTLCWTCKHIVPNREGTRGCSWGRFLIPVEGWKAIPTNTCGPGSYRVIECPQYERGGCK